jgi:hypothetical protein
MKFPINSPLADSQPPFLTFLNFVKYLLVNGVGTSAICQLIFYKTFLMFVFSNNLGVIFKIQPLSFDPNKPQQI